MTIHEVTPDIVEELYETYRLYGHFDIVKPIYSNPWKPEYMVYFKKSPEPLRRKGEFNKNVYKFLNMHANDIVVWSEALGANAESIAIGGSGTVNPLQRDHDFQKTCNDLLFSG